MATKLRKQRSDSIAAKVDAFKHAKTIIYPSIELRADEMNIFNEIINARPLASWVGADVDIRTASTLARQIRMQEMLMEQILEEGASIEENGKSKLNPAFSASEMIGRTIFSAQRHLGLSAVQRGLALKDTNKQTALERQARNLSGNGEDELLRSTGGGLLA